MAAEVNVDAVVEQRLRHWFREQDPDGTGYVQLRLVLLLFDKLGLGNREAILTALQEQSVDASAEPDKFNYNAFLDRTFGGAGDPGKAPGAGSAGGSRSSISRRRGSVTSVRRSLRASTARSSAMTFAGLYVDTGTEYPDLNLPMDLKLEFGKKIGRGASGATVFKCVASPLQGESSPVNCAAKVLALATGTYPDMVEDLGREIEIMKGLRHPALVGFICAGKVQAPNELLPISSASGAGGDKPVAAYALCIELCDLALEKVVQQRSQEARPFSAKEIGPALTQVSAGLAHLHQNGILHRDMKSANVFLQHIVPVGSGAEAPKYSVTARSGDGSTRQFQFSPGDGPGLELDASSVGQISRVVPGSAAEAQGAQPGWTITHIAGSEVRLMSHARALDHLAKAESGELQEPLCAKPLTEFQAKLGDFGASSAAARASTPVQTPQWMAPEAMRLEGYGPPADVWAFGMLMYELLELDLPFGEEITLPELEDQLTAGRAPLLKKGAHANQSLPKFVALMNRCHMAEADARPSASEVHSDLLAEGWAVS